MKRKNWFMLLAGVLVLAFVVLVRSDRGEAAVPPEEPARALGPMDVATARAGTLETGIAVTGSLEPHEQVEIKAQLGGQVSRVLVEQGIPVRQGQVLAELDAGALGSQLLGAEAQIASAQAALANAGREVESARMLASEGALAERDLRQAESGYAAARAQVAAAQAQRAQLADSRAKAVVRAPISGIVSVRAVSAGEVVNPGQTMFTLVNVDHLELAARVPAAEVVRVRAGQPVTFTVDGFPGRDFSGVVVRIDPVADPATRQVTTYVRLPNPDRELVGGLFASGRIQSGAAATGVLVPAESLRGESGSHHVLVVEGERIVRVPVEVVAREQGAGRVAVGGLEEGATVVTGPAAGLDAGTRVRLSGAAHTREG
jgi:membrane fusion protein, multidrug efflux system